MPKHRQHDLDEGPRGPGRRREVVEAVGRLHPARRDRALAVEPLAHMPKLLVGVEVLEEAGLVLGHEQVIYMGDNFAGLGLWPLPGRRFWDERGGIIRTEYFLPSPSSGERPTI